MHPEREREIKQWQRLLKRGTIFQDEFDRMTGKTLPEWFTNRIDTATVEAKYREYSRWHRLKDQIAEGDELWEYRMPEHLRVIGRDEGGIALVRDGVVLDSMVTRRGF